METLYIDTNIILNVIFGEKDFVESSFSLLQKIENNRYSAVTSLLTLMEMHRILQKQGKSEDDIKDVIQKIHMMGIEIILPEKEDIVKAYELIKNLRIDPMDSIHLSVALDSSSIFVTRDKEFANKINSVLRVMEPDDLN